MLQKINNLGRKAAEGFLKVLGMELKEEKTNILAAFILVVSGLIIFTAIGSLFN